MEAGESVEAGGSVRAGTFVRAGESVEAGTFVRAGMFVEAGTFVRAGGSVEAGEDYGIYAGLNIKISLKAQYAIVIAKTKPKNLLLGTFQKAKDAASTCSEAAEAIK